MKLKYGIIPVFFFMAAFLACSDESVSEKTEFGTTSDGNVADSIKDLPDCDEDHEGELYWVSSENQYRICKDEKWFGVMKSDDDDEAEEISCKTEKLKKESGYKVVCNGDSVGVLMNGLNAKPVESDDDESVDCVFDDLVEGSLKLVCGSKEYEVPLDSTTLTDVLGAKLEDDEESVEVDSEQIVTSLEDVSGYSQKGPFLLGSEVVAYELQNGRTLKQTGKQFHGKISDDKGSFNIRTVKITSQYAYLAAKGFYRNEVSGHVSDQQITLNALTDLSNRNTANINVLTHLEYDRIVHLVTQEKVLFRKAKNTAEEEIFKIFHMDSLDVEGVSEDFSIGGSGAGDAALLAMSALLQRNQTEAEMQSQITSMSESIAKTGTWDDDSLKTVMADWAVRMELGDSLKLIRSNVEGWKLNENPVGEFEPMIHNFWIQEYGIGECSKKRAGEVYAVNNKYSVNDESKSLVRFICAESADKNGEYAWRYATDFEKDTYGWSTDVEDGVKKSGFLTDSVYYFDAKDNVWKIAWEIEKMYGGCREEIYGQIRRVGDYNAFYRCDERTHSWQPVYEYTEIDTQGWGKGKSGEFRWGDSLGVSVVGPSRCNTGGFSYRELNIDGKPFLVKFGESLLSPVNGNQDCYCAMLYSSSYTSANILTGFDSPDVSFTFCNLGERNCYYYDESSEKWLHSSMEHCLYDYGIGRCSSMNLGEQKFSSNFKKVYECVNDRTFFEGHSYDTISLIKAVWRVVEDNVLTNTFGLECDEDKWMNGMIDVEKHYVCDNGEWRNATPREEIAGEPCFLSNQTFEKDFDGELHICVNSDWRLMDDVIANTYDVECDEDKWIVGPLYPTKHFVCRNGLWQRATQLEEGIGKPCISSNLEEEVVFEGYAYTCNNSGWMRL